MRGFRRHLTMEAAPDPLSRQEEEMKEIKQSETRFLSNKFNSVFIYQENLHLPERNAQPSHFDGFRIYFCDSGVGQEGTSVIMN